MKLLKISLKYKSEIETFRDKFIKKANTFSASVRFINLKII